MQSTWLQIQALPPSNNTTTFLGSVFLLCKMRQLDQMTFKVPVALNLWTEKGREKSKTRKVRVKINFHHPGKTYKMASQGCLKIVHQNHSWSFNYVAWENVPDSKVHGRQFDRYMVNVIGKVKLGSQRLGMEGVQTYKAHSKELPELWRVFGFL